LRYSVVRIRKIPVAKNSAMPETDNAAAEEIPIANLAATLSDGTVVKRRLPRQRACSQPQGKTICAGHLKRWYEFGVEVKEMFGKDAEIYRCERCQTLYLPNEEEVPRTGTLAF
jgi:hypothetical protein